MTSEPQMERNRRAHILSNWNKPAMNESLLAFSGSDTVVAVRLKKCPLGILNHPNPAPSPPFPATPPLSKRRLGGWWWWWWGYGPSTVTVRARAERLAETPRRLQNGHKLVDLVQGGEGGRVRDASGEAVGRRWERSRERERGRRGRLLLFISTQSRCL